MSEMAREAAAGASKKPADSGDSKYKGARKRNCMPSTPPSSAFTAATPASTSPTTPRTSPAAACSDPSRRNSSNRDHSPEYRPGGSELRAESASPPISDGTVQRDCDLGKDTDMDMDGRYLDLPRGNVGSGNYATDVGSYPGHDPFTTNDYYGHATVPNVGFASKHQPATAAGVQLLAFCFYLPPFFPLISSRSSDPFKRCILSTQWLLFATCTKLHTSTYDLHLEMKFLDPSQIVAPVM
ncbi:hypothetical protein ACJRO7_013834 [Eucalyptus globulus]|uniref:Uncharacterized protein n=1 Tax=Eucalyptus globulus TaxID=34317 RepID=A0ABD3KZA1_EUCGL